MADLTNQEKRKFERLFGLSSGYVFDFSNRTFAEFVEDLTGRNIYDQKYNYGSGSKANRLRGFWTEEPNHLTAKLLRALLEHGRELNVYKNDPPELIAACEKSIARLEQVSAVADMGVLTAIADDRDFEAVAKAVRHAIDSNELESGLDRLHTFTIKFIRTLCDLRGVVVTKDKPLHSIYGEYVKKLRDAGHIESEMASRILRSSISVLEAFNDVRNDRSLAHDNHLLGYDEALLIFNNIAASVRFLKSLEGRLAARAKEAPSSKQTAPDFDDDIPF